MNYSSLNPYKNVLRVTVILINEMVTLSRSDVVEFIAELVRIEC